MNRGHPYPHRTPEQMLDFLRTHARRDESCLIWAGAKDASGYPKVTWHGKTQSAKRLLANLIGRAPHRRQVVYASCGNILCMSEAHMRIGNRRHAHASAKKNGGSPTGVHRSIAVANGRAPGARMGYQRAPEVFRLLDAGATYRQIGERFGVDKSNVYHAIRAWSRMGITPMTTRIAA